MRLPLTMLAVALIAVPAHASELTGTLQKVKETNRIILGIQEARCPSAISTATRRRLDTPSISA